MDNKDKFARAQRVLEIACRMAEKTDKANGGGYTVQNSISEIGLFTHYSEPGYDGELIALGNWNDVISYDHTTKTRKVVSNLPTRVGDILEKLGFELEWIDKWTNCCDCGGLVRTQGDSYSWTRSYHECTGNGEVSCIDCLQADPESYLSELEGNCDTANTISEIDPADHGYVKVNEDSYESGYYPGQHDQPQKVAKELEKMGVSRYLFNIDSVGQFESKWSVFVHESEKDLLFPDDENEGPNNEQLTAAAPIARVDVPCKQCGRNVYADDAVCWHCEVSQPGKK